MGRANDQWPGGLTRRHGRTRLEERMGLDPVAILSGFRASGRLHVPRRIGFVMEDGEALPGAPQLLRPLCSPLPPSSSTSSSSSSSLSSSSSFSSPYTSSASSSSSPPSRHPCPTSASECAKHQSLGGASTADIKRGAGAGACAHTRSLRGTAARCA